VPERHASEYEGGRPATENADRFANDPTWDANVPIRFDKAPSVEGDIRYPHRMTLKPSPDIPLFIRRIMPDSSEAELMRATEILFRYMAIVAGIQERIRRERSDKRFAE